MRNDRMEPNRATATSMSSPPPMIVVNESDDGQFYRTANNPNDSQAASHSEFGKTADRMTAWSSPSASASFHDDANMRPSPIGKERRGLRSNDQIQSNAVTKGLSSVPSRSDPDEPSIVLADQSSSTYAGENELSVNIALDQQHRRLSDANDAIRDVSPATIGSAILKNKQNPERKRTLVVYSGPTSLDSSIGKNAVYLTNFEYFVQHGIECHGLGGTNKPDQTFEDLNLQYVIVLTQDVADRYTAENGLITRKQTECRAARQEWQQMNKKVVRNDNSLITVLVREDRCYDMESLLLVSRTYDIPHLYDHMVYINCGLAGPKFGPGSPENWERMSSWTELYTSLLSDKVQMVGHTINTHYNTVYSPHIQSFLFAVNTPMIDIWLKTGAIYECGISNEDFRDELVKMALVWRYEVGISRVLLERGYSIAAAFMHQQGVLGAPLIIDNNSTFGRNFGREEIIHSDVFLEEGVRRLTESSFPEYDDHRKYAILPWDCYVFFKVSRLIPSDIQGVMQYEQLGPVTLVPNDARLSSVREWRRRAGVSMFGELKKILPGVSYTASTGTLKCYGRHCEFDEVATVTGELVGAVIIFALLVWYVATSFVVERRISLERLKRRKWK